MLQLLKATNEMLEETNSRVYSFLYFASSFTPNLSVIFASQSTDGGPTTVKIVFPSTHLAMLIHDDYKG